MRNTQAVKVSIALATYNGEQYLKEQLESILNQSYLPFEVVIMDDASNDRTLEIAREFASKAPFQVIISSNNETLGYTKNFSNALSNCTGDIVLLCDQDDVWHENKIETIINFLTQNPKTQLAIHDLAFCDADLNLTGQTKLSRVSATSSPLMGYVTGMATAVRGPFLKACLPIPNNGVTHDLWLHSCAILFDVKSIIPTVLSLYRRHGNNVTNVNSLNSANKSTWLTLHLNSFKAADEIELINSRARCNHLINWLVNGKFERINNFQFDPTLIEKSLTCLKKDIQNIEDRLELRKLNRKKRFIPVIRHYFRGGYSTFSGFKSALKDLCI